MGGRDNGPEAGTRLPTPPQQPGAGTRGASAHRRRCAGHVRDVARHTQPGAVGFNADWTWPYQGEPWRRYLGRAWPA